MTARLDGKIALIIGGTTGIGEAAAKLFKAEGATVIATGNNPANVERAQNEFGVEAIRSDITRLDEIDALMAHVAQHHRSIDVLFVSAGLGSQRPIEAVDAAYFQMMFDANVRGTYFNVKQALPLLGEGASVILTASVAAHKGAVGGTVYAATKAAVRSLGRGFAAELAPRKIRVNTLTPGPIDTPLMDKSGVPRAMVAEMMVKMVPMGRMGTALEAANAALFLASDESSFMTGAELMVGGGMIDL